MSTTSSAHTPLLSELKCYSLPYGLLGFISHLLTYLTLLCLWYGRKPLLPWKYINNTKLDLGLAGVGLLLCIVMSCVTMVRCYKEGSWQMLLVALWKMAMSIVNGVTALHVAIIVVPQVKKKKDEQTDEAKGNDGPNIDMTTTGEEMKKRTKDERRETTDTTLVNDETTPKSKEKKKKEKKKAEPPPSTKHTAYWTLLYLPGMLAGIVGLMSLVHRLISTPDEQGNFTISNKGNISDLLRLTIAFYAIVGASFLGGLAGMLYILFRPSSTTTRRDGCRLFTTGFVFTLFLWVILAAFYSDWALGMMMDNLTGVPSGDHSAFYWTYFVAKRLTMFCA